MRALGRLNLRTVRPVAGGAPPMSKPLPPTAAAGVGSAPPPSPSPSPGPRPAPRAGVGALAPKLKVGGAGAVGGAAAPPSSPVKGEG